MIDTLNELTSKYLRENGIMIKFLAEYIHEDYTIVRKWLKGSYCMSPESIKRVHEFLEKSHKSIDQILKEE